MSRARHAQLCLGRVIIRDCIDADEGFAVAQTVTDPQCNNVETGVINNQIVCTFVCDVANCNVRVTSRTHAVEASAVIGSPHLSQDPPNIIPSTTNGYIGIGANSNVRTPNLSDGVI